jgi:diguanylate cyclase (GGDEF)-like protein/PAS domain S-box-containing protein
VFTTDLSSLFELLPIGAYRLAPDGTILRVNLALVQLNGYASEVQMRAALGNIFPDPYLLQGRRQEFLNLLWQYGHVTNFESEMVRMGNGQHWWVREHAHVVLDNYQQVMYYEGTIEDITQERAAKALLHQRESLLHNLLQTIPDRVWLKDMQGVYLTCNEAFAAHLGVHATEVVGTNDTHWLEPELAERFLATDRMALQAGKAVTLEEEMPTPIASMGTLYEVIKTPMYDAQGNAIGVLGMARDIQQRKDAEALLRDTSEQLELAIMGADLGRWDHDVTQTKGYFLDERACRLLGRDLSESKHGRAWGHLVHPDDLPATVHAMRAHLAGTTPAYEVDYRARHTDGRWIWLSSRGKVVQFGRDGAPQRMVGTLMDISERKLAESQLRATQAELRATLDALPDLLFEFNAEGRYRAVHSHNEVGMTLPTELVLNKVVSEVLPKEAAEACLAALQEAKLTGRSSGKQYSLELSGGKHWFELSVVRKPTEPDEEERFIAIARNISERKLTEEAIQHLAFHDSLTDLPNRRLLTNRLQSALTASARHGRHGALMFLDLDKFKLLNDTYGHDIGDLMLQEVARRLQQNVRAVDTVARLGGDEFVVLLQELSTDADDALMHATIVGHKILASLNDPYTLGEHTHISTPSIGGTLFQGEEVSALQILKNADTAMYKAKALGRNTLCFNESHLGPDATTMRQQRLNL